MEKEKSRVRIGVSESKGSERRIYVFENPDNSSPSKMGYRQTHLG